MPLSVLAPSGGSALPMRDAALALGVPVGAGLDYRDECTLDQVLAARAPVGRLAM